MTRSSTDPLETLTNELIAFCHSQQLPQECADHLLKAYTLTPPQRRWLTDFCERWDALNQPKADTRATLVAELRAFCAKEGLPRLSAEALITNPALTDQQRQWAAEFWGRWDALITAEDNWDDEDDIGCIE